MTTNRDRAAREVVSAVQNEGIAPNYHRQQLRRLRREWPTLYYALRHLERATPNLPEPSRTMFPGGRVWTIEGPVGDVRATSTGEVVAFGTWQEQPFRIVATPEKMRTLARTLEAAADHAEKAAAHVDETLGDTDD